MAKRTANHPVNEVLSPGKLFVFGLQHVLAMYAGAVTVPLVIGAALHLTSDQVVFLISADLFTCGIATLIQTIGFWKFGIRIPVIQGVTFVCVQPIIAIGLGVLDAGGAPEVALVVIFISVIASGLFTILAAPLFSKLIRLFPPLVTGTVILSIGLSLLPVAIKMMGGQNFMINGEPAHYGSPPFLLVSLLVILTILIANRYFKGFMKSISVLLGMGVGFIACLFLGYIDFTVVSEAAWFRITLPFGLNMPGLDNGHYFQILSDPLFLASIGPAIISLIIVMIIVMVESTGDYLAIGEIIDLDISGKDIADGLRADGLSTMIGGMFNAMPYTAFAQNVGLVALTGVRSRWVVASAGVILILLGLTPKLAAVFDALPPFIIGGAAFVMFATVAANGIKTLSKADLTTKPNNLFVIAISIAVGMIPTVGALTVAVPPVQDGLYHIFPFFNMMPKSLGPVISSSISLTAFCAVLLNLFFNGYSGDKGLTIDASGATSSIQGTSEVLETSEAGGKQEGQDQKGAQKKKGEQGKKEASGEKKAPDKGDTRDKDNARDKKNTR